MFLTTFKPQSQQTIWTALAAIVFGVSFMPTVSFADESVSTPPSQSSIKTDIQQPDGPPQKKMTQFRYRFGISGESFEEATEQARTAGFGIEGDLRQHLGSDFDFHAQAKAIAQAGQAQSAFGENIPQNGVFLEEAIVTYKPIQEIHISGGAIDQDYLRAPLLISGQPFPGVMERLNFGNSRLGLEIKAEQTVPTSISLSTKVSDREPTPTFTAETITLSGMPDRLLKLEMYVTHYEYSTLPSTVAIDSESFGNTPVEEAGTQSTQFLYRFNGVLGGAQGTWTVLPRTRVMLGGQYLHNMDAPTKSNDGFLSYLATDYRYSGSLSIIPRVEYFFAESDVAPAYYNSSEYGHNNRVGYAGQVELNFLRQGFKLKARYVDANLINGNVNQSHQRYILLSVETFYAKL